MKHHEFWTWDTMICMIMAILTEYFRKWLN